MRYVLSCQEKKSVKRRSDVPRKWSLFSLVLLIYLLAGCGYQGTTANTGQQSQNLGIPKGSCPAAETMTDAGASKVAYTVSWEAVGADADNNQGTSALQVSALEVASGKVLWRKAPIKISALYQSSIQQVVDGVLYLAGMASQSMLVLAVDTRDGHAIWQYTQKQASVSSLSICAGKVYLGVGGVEVLALRASNGQVLWSHRDRNVSVSNTVVTTHAAYLVEQWQTSSGAMSSSVIALGADDGQVLWRKEQQGLGLSLVANGSAVYVINPVPSSSPGDPMMTPVASVQALDGESGTVIWQAKMPPNMEQIRVLRVGDTLYLNGQYLLDQSQSLLVALNASNGKRLWLRQHDYTQLTILSEQDLYGYQGYAPGDDPRGKKRFCSLNGVTGKDRWCVDSLQPSLFSLSATRDTVIVEEELQPGPLTLIQNIYGVSKQDGKILWKLPWKSSLPSVQTLTLVTVVEKQSFTPLIS
jgi:outer membrane protein assembly factor BamB